MGSGRWDPSDWAGYTKGRGYDTKTVHDIYSKGLDSELNPKGIKFRESRDSSDNPESTPLIVALDVTGSMSSVLDVMAKQGLNTLVKEVYDRKPIHDPHVLCMGIGDVECDSAPLQVTQFEADLRIAKQLEKLYLERGGGGNSYESYAVAWYFAAHHTVHDSFEKRGKKGYLFTIGDERPTARLAKHHIEEFIGDTLEADVNMDALLTLVSRQWDVFHLMVGTTPNAHHDERAIREQWTEKLGQRAIWLSDHTKLAEVIVSTIQVYEGADTGTVVDSWDGSTSMVVREAVRDLKRREKSSDGVVAL